MRTITHEAHGKGFRDRTVKWERCRICGRARKYLTNGLCGKCSDSRENTEAEVQRIKSVIQEVVREARTVSVEKTG